MKLVEHETTFSGMVQLLASAYLVKVRERFEFSSIEWSDPIVVGDGASGPVRFRVQVSLTESPPNVLARCSLCGRNEICIHAKGLIIELADSGIAEDIEQGNFAPIRFTPKKADPAETKWKTKLGRLAEQIRYRLPHELQVPKLPAGREVIYVIELDSYNEHSDSLKIVLVTRFADPARQAASTTSVPSKKGKSELYRYFSGGSRGLYASPDPLDHEIADRLSMTARENAYYSSYDQTTFLLAIDRAGDLIARLARSGRLYLNREYHLNDRMIPLGWLCDEKCEAKFEIASHDVKRLRLGLSVYHSQGSIPYGDLIFRTQRYFVDAQHRLGLFSRPLPVELGDSFKPGKPVLVPREHAQELIGQVMNFPLKLGIDFVSCDEIQPRRIRVAPRPRIHINAPQQATDWLNAEVAFDYDGVHVPLGQTRVEHYDVKRGAIVEIDAERHQRGSAFLTSIGVKIRANGDIHQVRLPKRKLVTIVGTLIRDGWHVEADGKLYRTGSTFELKIASGIDWFELNGKAQFDQISVDLPRLLKSLRAGEQSVVLDDGSIGLIPEDWIKRFGNLANMSTSADGLVKFGKAQVGLLDALLAEQGEVDTDAAFAAARDALRGFERIGPQEAPDGFIGELRPYQKIALGWFGFLRNLGFGGCLADDMGLGKTIQVLALLQDRHRHNAGPSLIVVPRSLIFNWTAEARKFAPELRVLDQSHSQRTRGTEHLSEFDIVLTTYGTLRRDAAFLKDFEFDYVILDEAQAIKNAATAAAKAARLLKGRHKLALSGTPIENRLGELWSLFDFLNPGMLGRVGRFASFARAADDDERRILAAAVRPFLLRRTKKQVAPELPERVEQTVVVELDAEQRRCYDELREHYRRTLLNKIEVQGMGKSRFVILEALLRLRQAACHPGLVDKARVREPSAKLDELLSRLNTVIESGERVLVFSQFTSLLAIVKHRLKLEAIEFLYLDGQTKNRQALVDQFQSGEGPAVFLISLKAGGVGLNLTAARTVYLLDPWWNPAVEAQAIDRAHRIGQPQTVFATRLIAADTVEQKVLDLQAQKKGLADAIINADSAGISSLTRKDLELLLT